jgi:hypothetical protein
MHDAGKILNPLIAEGQMRGAFAQGIARRSTRSSSPTRKGAFLTGTFADYLVPTVSEIHRSNSCTSSRRRRSPRSGAKGLAEGNCMSVPACIANAIADALGVKERAAAGDSAPHPRADGAERRRAMKPRPFDTHGPDTVDETVALLAEHGDEARILAGGQSLMAMMNLRLADPAMLIDIARIAELSHIRDLGDTIESAPR